MDIVFSDHGEERRRQRGFSDVEVRSIIEIHKSIKNRDDGLIEVIGVVKNRLIKVVYREEESYIKIVSVM